MLEKIPGNAREDALEFSRTFRGILEKIPATVTKDFGKYYQRFRKITENNKPFIAKTLRKTIMRRAALKKQAMLIIR